MFGEEVFQTLLHCFRRYTKSAFFATFKLFPNYSKGLFDIACAVYISFGPAVCKQMFVRLVVLYEHLVYSKEYILAVHIDFHVRWPNPFQAMQHFTNSPALMQCTSFHVLRATELFVGSVKKARTYTTLSHRSASRWTVATSRPNISFTLANHVTWFP